MARYLIEAKVVDSISAETVRRILAANELKPWHQHSWLSPKVPRDAEFARVVQEIVDLYTRPLADEEVVLSIDEKTNIQPRRRMAPSRAARRRKPVLVESDYRRDGALNLIAAFNTRSGEVTAVTAERKRADEFLSLLELVDAHTPATISTVHVLVDNLRVHKCRAVQAWLAAHPRFIFHFTPVHCSWLNQIEQWFSILQRKALRRVDFAGALALCRHLYLFIAHWNRIAHPFNWSTKSVAKVLAKCTAADALPNAA